MTFIILSCFGTYSDWFIRGLATACIPISIIRILQFLGKNPFGLFLQGFDCYAAHPFLETLGNINMISGFVALVVPAVACAYIFFGKKSHALFIQLNINSVLFFQLNFAALGAAFYVYE